jgi:hypothetical protein
MVAKRKRKLSLGNELELALMDDFYKMHSRFLNKNIQ